MNKRRLENRRKFGFAIANFILIKAFREFFHMDELQESVSDNIQEVETLCNH